MVLTSARPSDGAIVSVTIRRVGVLAFGDCQYMHVFNILMRHCLQNMQLQQVSDIANKNCNLALNTLKTKDRLVSFHHSCSFACVMCDVCVCSRVRACMCVCYVCVCVMCVCVFFNVFINKHVPLQNCDTTC
jgi:hypothetical protein